jgi:cytochrome P450
LGANPEPSQIAQMPYLTAVCQETLRIYSIAMAGFLQVVKNSIEIMDYKFP